jgi:hypothetical protein
MYTVLKRGGRLFGSGMYGADVDITDHAPAYSMVRCELEPGVTLEDLMLLVSRNHDFWEQVFGFSVKETISRFLNAVAVNNPSFDYLSVDYVAEMEDGFLVGLSNPVCDFIRRDGSRGLIRAAAPEYLIGARVVLGSLIVNENSDGVAIRYESATFNLASILRTIFLNLRPNEFAPVAPGEEFKKWMKELV